MMRTFCLAAGIAGLLIAGMPVSVSADSSGKSKYSRSGKPQVRGYVQRRGGYSYRPEDTINTYGDSRGRYGAANSFRDPWADRQTRFGPFNEGFFFESGIQPRGGNLPYPN